MFGFHEGKEFVVRGHLHLDVGLCGVEMRYKVHQLGQWRFVIHGNVNRQTPPTIPFLLKLPYVFEEISHSLVRIHVQAQDTPLGIPFISPV